MSTLLRVLLVLQKTQNNCQLDAMLGLACGQISSGFTQALALGQMGVIAPIQATSTGLPATPTHRADRILWTGEPGYTGALSECGAVW